MTGHWGLPALSSSSLCSNSTFDGLCFNPSAERHKSVAPQRSIRVPSWIGGNKKKLKIIFWRREQFIPWVSEEGGKGQPPLGYALGNRRWEVKLLYKPVILTRKLILRPSSERIPLTPALFWMNPCLGNKQNNLKKISKSTWSSLVSPKTKAPRWVEDRAERKV